MVMPDEYVTFLNAVFVSYVMFKTRLKLFREWAGLMVQNTLSTLQGTEAKKIPFLFSHITIQLSKYVSFFSKNLR